MMCKNCCAAGSALVAATEQKNDGLHFAIKSPSAHESYRIPVNELLRQAGEKLHKLCTDARCSCAHKSNVIIGIDWQKVKGNEQEASEEV